MRRVEFDPGRLTGEQAEWWERWEELAAEARAELRRRHEAGEEWNFDSKIWARLKEWLYEHVFGERCAYCEGKSGGQAFVRGEHWRPKGALFDDREGVRRAIEREGEEHKGYWWLAYEWTNLLPSCERCNNEKASRFPVRGEHVFEPGEEETVEALDAREQPLLLHPLRGEDPADHIGFDEFGGVYAKDESPLGKETIRVLGLERGRLEDERFAAIRTAMDVVENAAAKVVANDVSYDEAIGDRLEETAFLSAVIPQAERRRIRYAERFQPSPESAT